MQNPRSPRLPPQASEPGLFRAAPLPIAALDDGQRLACLRLIRSENVGPVTFREIINRFGGAQAALDALPEIQRRFSRGKPIRICPRDTALAELEAAERIGAVPIFTIEPAYPAALAHVDVPPPLLYVKGRADLLNRDVCAIVGARNCSAAGTTLTRMFAARLGEAGYVVASGLARGVDGAAHDAALATGTIAVLAGGPDFVYPPEHAALQERISVEGCLVSELPPGFQPRAQDFPRRNRIISGISLGVIVMEAAKRSGTLITARMAAEQGRLVLAVPGHPLDPRAEGTNGLIRNGATMVTSADEVLEALASQSARTWQAHAPGVAEAAQAPRTLEPSRADSVAPPSPVETGRVPMAASGFDAPVERVAEALGPAPCDLDAVVRATGLDIGAVLAALLELSLAGRIEHHGAALVSLRREA